jgi:hypothetical protein
MKPSIDQINETLNDEQKIEIHSIDEKKSKVIYDSVVRMNKLQNVVPLMYNSNIGTTLLRAEPIKEAKPIESIPKIDIPTSTKKDLDNWKKDVILWYEKNKNNLPSNVIPKDRMIDMVYKQYMAYKTKPTTVEDRLSALEEKVDKILKKLS